MSKSESNSKSESEVQVHTSFIGMRMRISKRE